MSKFDDIKIPDNIDEITKKAVKRGIDYKKRNRYEKIMIASVTLIGVIATIGISSPSLADNIPILGDIFDKINYALKNNEAFKDNLDDVNMSSEYNGLTITVDKALYDGNKVYMDLTIKTEEPFKNTEYAKALDEYEYDHDDKKMVYYFSQDFPEFKINGVRPNGYGADIPRVRFVDEYTLKGNAIVDFDAISRVDSEIIDFEMEFGLFGGSVDENGDNEKLDGKWSFKFPIGANKEDTKFVDINQTKNGFTLHQVLLTPMSISIDITAPKEYYNSFDIMEAIEVRDDQGNILWATSGNYENYDNVEDHKISELRYKQRYDLESIGDDIKYVDVVFYGQWNEETESAPILADFRVNF